MQLVDGFGGVSSGAMCCFSEPVEYVSGTQIFARALADGRQALVYSMSFQAAGELAMILPLPVPAASPEDAVRFVSLEGYDDFFSDVAKGFPSLDLAIRGAPQAESASVPVQSLVVHDVGDFEASFVPTLADFDRLDARFKLDPEVWAQLPQYGDWGFAVFKLKPERQKLGFFARLFGRTAEPKRQTVHPMAFEFPRRDPRSLFFPTVHVHDGEVHEKAHFDHTLYCQPGDLIASTFGGWNRSAGPLGRYVDSERAAGLIAPDTPCYRTVLMGDFENRDQVLTPPPVDHAGLLLRRGRCFELRLGATACYRDPRVTPAPSHDAWRKNATEHLDDLGEQLSARADEALAAQKDALGLADYDDTLPVFGHRTGHIHPLPIPGSRHRPAEPGEPVLVELEVSDDRVEPQRFRVAFVEPPSVDTVLTVQHALERALSEVELPA